MHEVLVLQGVSLILLLGIIVVILFNKIKIPSLIGLLILGIVIGPYALNLIDSKTIELSGIIRQIALVVILIRAGLGIKKKDILQVGAPAIRLSFIPVIFEATAITVLSMLLFSFDFFTAGLLGCAIAAVSPAVIVPSMLDLSERKIGEDKKIPTMILASASIDDIVAIILFSIFLSLSVAKSSLFSTITQVPTGIFLGIASGVFLSIVLILIFKKIKLSPIYKALIIFGISLLLLVVEELLDNLDYISLMSLLGVIVLAFTISEKDNETSKEISPIFKNIWIFASLFLFVLVAAKMDPSVALDAGLKGALIIFVGLFFRSIGVYISLLGTNLLPKEKLFCIFSFMPKATVQAAIGAIPLSLGIEGGEIILAICVLSIFITAPLGAFLISKFSHLIDSSQSQTPS